jgi:hypothetical protein
MMWCLGVACGGARSSQPTPDDPFATNPPSALSVAPLSGQNALLLTVGALVLGDSLRPLVELEPRRAELLALANAALDSALRRDAREVTWYAPAEQRRAARGAPTLNLQPDNFHAPYLADRRAAAIADPLRAQLRGMAALTGSRIAVVPAALRLHGPPDALTATFIMVAVDTRLGSVVWRGRVSGTPQADAARAIASAAALVIAPQANR